jgi:uncharacterized protein (DUF488 family)
VIHTIGHSTRPIQSFLELLEAYAIRQLADVRTVPRSRRHPQFMQDSFRASLHAQHVVYRHFPGLGGLRKPRADSINTGLTNPSFRGYADHMQTEEFRRAFAALEVFAGEAATAVMCAEAVWWKCHRRLLADALLVHGVPVLHIVSRTTAKPHELSEFARERDGGVIYPGLL